ncbi:MULTISPECIES: DUF5667 domain-containing protein [Bacillaceae]|uniref:DUF5667 domain-containing protein n=1 Tax=Bacillaceae TaxID=186817 RepID=UPI001C5604BC|nr:DUF5667 domain-containing protein [Rossellomorea sp. YZS02]MBW3114119.1 hypothetical protein [Bacillus sp. MCCB 382]MDX8345766.1 hypothetical protein [Rossellomorea sp. YZS02]
MKKQSKIMKSSLAVLVASSISFPSSLAFANSNDENFDSIKLEQGTTNETVAVNDDAMLNSAKKEIENLKESTETPSLLPGDFFYFAKVAIEKIQLAFTMDDAKEAKLLAEYASERLAEVEALFKDGKQEEAIDALNNAIEMIEQSEDQWSDDESEEDSTVEDKEEADSDETVVEEDDATDEDSVIEEEKADDTDIEEKTEENSDDMSEMEEMMAQNILSLKANLEKVKNPKAKAALQKNIEKSYMKLAEKLAKIEEKAARKAEAEEKTEAEDELNIEETTVENNEAVEADAKESVDETTEVEVKEEKAAPVTVNPRVEKKEAKSEWKNQHKEIKQEAKEARKQEKEEAKEYNKKKNEEKKHHSKSDENRQHGEKGKEHGKGHHKE